MNELILADKGIGSRLHRKAGCPASRHRENGRKQQASPSNEQFLTDKEVSAWLKVSRRTLQDYRNNGIIAYYQLGGKILYKESDIERMLAANYREAFRRHP